MASTDNETYLGGVSYSLSSPDDAPLATVWFEDFGGTSQDSRSTLNWSTAIRDCDAPTGPGDVAFSNAPVSDPVVITIHPNADVLQGSGKIYAHIGFNDWATVLDPDVAMSRLDANNWQYSTVSVEGATNINLVFNDDASAVPTRASSLPIWSPTIIWILSLLHLACMPTAEISPWLFDLWLTISPPPTNGTRFHRVLLHR